MATTEHTINDALAQILRNTRRAWRESNVIQSEALRLIQGSNERPDIIVLESNVAPVVIETEILPATTVEAEAQSRLGKMLRTSGRTILSSIAVRMPRELRTVQADQLSDALKAYDTFEFALFTGDSPTNHTRLPHSGWMRGSVADLSILVQSSSVPPEIIDRAADTMMDGVIAASGLLEEIATSHLPTVQNISKVLRQEDGAQTRRMGATILANAFMFHEILAGHKQELDVLSFDQLRGTTALSGLTKGSVLREWRKILQVNYWPIFDIARRILEVLPTHLVFPMVETLATTAEKLLQNRLMRSHDLTGSVFQRLIVDRKFLAAYYTTPASAAFLVGLTMSPEQLPSSTGGVWSDADAVQSLRIADFACGTGTLLSTIYHRVSQLHEIAGGDAEAIHAKMMAQALVGCDVLPAAAHLTASMLAGAYPTVKYTDSSILTTAYGLQPDGAIALGSLDLLEPQAMLDVLSITAKVAEGTGETEAQAQKLLTHNSFDVVIMNPPFTRSTGHEGNKIGVPNPMFAAFGTSANVQKLMSKALSKLTNGSSAHGNAGIASNFLVLADRKLKENGKLALVMPLSFLSGDAWEGSRQLLAADYDDLILASISGLDNKPLSFSADTGMGECLIIARKRPQDEHPTTQEKRAIFVILNESPAYPLVGMAVAEEVTRLIGNGTIRRLEDGPTGGTSLFWGTEIVGQLLSAPLPDKGGWNPTRIADLLLAQMAHQLTENGVVWLPTVQERDVVHVPMTTVAEIGKIGPYHADINGKTATGGVRGPFDLMGLPPHYVPTYPILWAHHAPRERTMLFPADHDGIPKQGTTAEEQALINRKVDEVWQTASHCHFNRDFRFNSQSTGMQFTKRKTVGGHAWLSIQLPTIEHEKALVAWANTTLGLFIRWWHSNKQHSGRGRMGKNSLATLSVLDVTALTPEQLSAAVEIFDEMCDRPLKPLHEMDDDPVRQALDEQFGKRVLQLPDTLFGEGNPLDILRRKLAAEPSIRGSKKF